MKYFPINSPCVCIGLLIFIIILGQVRGLGSKELVSQNPFNLYENKILFDVVRDGKKVGSHEVNFLGDQDDFWVTTRFELEIKVLFIRAYAFKYFSKANWKNSVLSEISIIVDDDGEPFSLKGRQEAGEFVVESSKTNFKTPLPLFPTNHWNSSVVNEKVVLNTLTGELNRVEIIARGVETLQSGHGKIKGQRYSYTGDLDTEVWYDEKGRWVGMKFEGKDGKTITYVCQKCFSSKDRN